MEDRDMPPKKKTYSDDEAINYILALENPTKEGWDPKKKIWTTPKRPGFDKNQIAGGLDIRQENNPEVYNFLKSHGRLNNPWLTDAEAKQLMMNTYAKKQDSIRKAIELAGGNVSQRGYNILQGMAWHGHPMKSLLSPDSITGKAFRQAVANGDLDLDQVFDTYYNYGSNKKQFAERIKADAKYRPQAQPQTYVLNDGTRVVQFEKPDWTTGEKRIPQVPFEVLQDNTVYPPAVTTPLYINMYNNPDSPSYGGTTPRIKGIQEYMNDLRNELNRVLPDTVITGDKPSPFALPTLIDMMNDGKEKWVRNITGMPSLYDELQSGPTINLFKIPTLYANKGKDLPHFAKGKDSKQVERGGITYNVHPSAIGASELEVEVPNTTVRSTPGMLQARETRNENARRMAEKFLAQHPFGPNTVPVEPGLELISPEFEILSLIGGLANTSSKAVRLAATKQAVKKYGNVGVGGAENSAAERALMRRWEPKEFEGFFVKNNPKDYYGINHDNYPYYVENSLNNSVYPRMRAARTDLTDQLFDDAFKYAADGKWTEYPDRTYKMAYGNETKLGGTYYPDYNHTAIREGHVREALGHEELHKLEEFFPRTQAEKQYLDDAFDDDFLALGNEGLFKGYDMNAERRTTNYDSRKEFFGEDADQKLSLKLQSQRIWNASDEEIFDAVEYSNAYGQAYIEAKRKAGQLTHELADKIRKSWDKVGVGIPIVGGSALYNLMQQSGILSPTQTLVDGINSYNKGKDIYIKPSKRGTFTAAAKKHGKSVQAFASLVLANPGKYSTAMRKKALFARNSKKWSKK